MLRTENWELRTSRGHQAEGYFRNGALYFKHLRSALERT